MRKVKDWNRQQVLVHYWKQKQKKSEEFKQLQEREKIMELLAKQIAQFELDKAEYQRTGIQH